MNNVVIFCGGEPIGPWAKGEIPDDAFLIAADSGLDHAHALDIDVDIVVGDLDSVGEHALAITDATVERHSPDKDATDLELALEAAFRHDPANIIILGGQGGRIDHQTANLLLVASPRWDTADIKWVGENARIRVIHAGLTVHGTIGSTITLLAVGGPATGVTTAGLKWNLRDETIEPGSTRGVSNVFTAPVSTIRVASGTLLAIQPDPA